MKPINENDLRPGDPNTVISPVKYVGKEKSWFGEAFIFSLLTTPQIYRKITAAAKRWVKLNGYNLIQVYSLRGNFYAVNCHINGLTAQYIYQEATGIEFKHITDSQAKPILSTD